VAALRISALLLACAATTAVAQSAGSDTIVYGGDAVDGWAFAVSAPPGWNFLCCDRADAFGANLLVFPQGWNGRGSDGVMVLTVWPKERSNVDADWQADADEYFAQFPGLTSISYQSPVKDAACLSSSSIGADGIADHVVFCDPGDDWHYRFAWSFSSHSDAADSAAVDAFRATVGSTSTMHMRIGTSPR